MNKELVERLREHGITHIGLAWYEAESYQQVVAVMEDRHTLPDTHAAWLPQALEAEESIRREGFVPVRVVMRPDEFVGFCRQHGLNINSQGRQHFASLVAAQAQRNRHNA